MNFNDLPNNSWEKVMVHLVGYIGGDNMKENYPLYALGQREYKDQMNEEDELWIR